MARKLDTYERLRLRAAKQGVSIQEELRRIEEEARQTVATAKRVMQKYFGDENGVNLELLKHPPHNPMTFNDCKANIISELMKWN